MLPAIMHQKWFSPSFAQQPLAPVEATCPACDQRCASQCLSAQWGILSCPRMRSSAGIMAQCRCQRCVTFCCLSLPGDHQWFVSHVTAPLPCPSQPIHLDPETVPDFASSLRFHDPRFPVKAHYAASVQGRTIHRFPCCGEAVPTLRLRPLPRSQAALHLPRSAVECLRAMSADQDCLHLRLPDRKGQKQEAGQRHGGRQPQLCHDQPGRHVR